MIADLSGKSALITGGASGIGRGISLALASQGSNVAIADKNIEGASKVSEEVKKLGRHSIAINVDVTDNSSITAMVNKTVKEFYYANHEKIFYTKYFGENGLAKLQKLIRENLQRLGDNMISGGVDNMEKYQYMLGQIRTYQYMSQEISSLLEKKERKDDGTVISIKPKGGPKI